MRTRPLLSLLALVLACSGGGETMNAGGAATTSTGPVTYTLPGTGGAPPDTFTIAGVVTDGVAPVEGAIVMQGGGEPQMTTGPDGAYSVTLSHAIPGTPTVVAAKIGYRSAGVEFTTLPKGPTDLALSFVAPPDNPGYHYGDPGSSDLDSTKFCSHCHITYVKQYLDSGHAEIARSELVQDLYAGVSEAYKTAAECAAAGGVFRAGIVPGAPGTSVEKCYLGGGVLPDLNPSCGGASGLACDDPALPDAQKPQAFGACADCHAPGIDGKAGGRNLHEATGAAFTDGRLCDVCHHARDVDLTKPAGVAGALVLQRPHEKVSDKMDAELKQVMYGPLPDVVNGFMGGSWQPKFEKSEFCGACHHLNQPALVPGTKLDAARWPNGLPVHSTYDEWKGSTYDTPSGPQCQTCHMPKDDTGLTNSQDVTKPDSCGIVYGFARKPEQNHQHTFRCADDGTPRFIDASLVLTVDASKSSGELAVEVVVENTGAGHAIPTGEPMRHLLLVVDAAACGQPMTPTGGMTIDDVGGAVAQGVVGAGATIAGATLTWPAGAKAAKAGDVIRAVRPTGTYDDYQGIGFFANPALTAAQKGLELRDPVGEAKVVSVSGGALVLSAALPVKAGDVLYLGDALVAPLQDDAPSLALAGLPGYSFAKVTVDPQGARGVPHYRAIDLASDNRIPTNGAQKTRHRFAIPGGCTAAEVTARLVYREVSVIEARRRGWEATEMVVGTNVTSVSLP